MEFVRHISAFSRRFFEVAVFRVGSKVQDIFNILATLHYNARLYLRLVAYYSVPYIHFPFFKENVRKQARQVETVLSCSRCRESRKGEIEVPTSQCLGPRASAASFHCLKLVDIYVVQTRACALVHVTIIASFLTAFTFHILLFSQCTLVCSIF